MFRIEDATRPKWIMNSMISRMIYGCHNIYLIKINRLYFQAFHIFVSSDVAISGQLRLWFQIKIDIRRKKLSFCVFNTHTDSRAHTEQDDSSRDK